MLHELHTNPQQTMQEILKNVSSAVGLDLQEGDMKELSSQMQWAQDLMNKILPLLPNSLPGKKAEEL